MFKRSLSALCLCVLTASAWAQTAGPAALPGSAPEAGEPVPEQILVTGQRPGPGLWKISKGEHVLWVFGSYAPLPQKMEWRSQQVDAILAQSQEYLPPPVASAGVGFFRSLTLLPFAIGFKNNPDGARLRDVLPADVYARWQVLKVKYIGDDDGIERERPLFAADELYRKGLLKAGLSPAQDVRKAIEKLVKKNNLKTTETALMLPLEEPVKLLRDFKKTPLDDAACFSQTLARLETDIDAMRIRANAWAKGDLEAIRKLSFEDQEAACKAAVADSALMKSQPAVAALNERLKELWLATAEKSLAANRSTFAILPLKNLLDPQGYVAALQGRGYAVESPE